MHLESRNMATLTRISQIKKFIRNFFTAVKVKLVK